MRAWKHRKLLMNLGNGVDAASVTGPASDRLVRDGGGARLVDPADLLARLPGAGTS